MTRAPQTGDLWHRDDAFMVVTAIYERDGELVGAEVQHSDDRDGVTSDVLWPDGFDGWEPGVCRATALADRPPTPERDERSELERLREEVRTEAAYSARQLLELVVGSDVIREWDHGPYEFGHHPWCEHTVGVPRLVAHGVMRWTGEMYGRWRVAELVDARCREAVDVMRSELERLREELAEVRSVLDMYGDNDTPLKLMAERCAAGNEQVVEDLIEAKEEVERLREEHSQLYASHVKAWGEIPECFSQEKVSLAGAIRASLTSSSIEEVIPRADVVRALRRTVSAPTRNRIAEELGITDDELRDAREGGE